MLAAEGGEGVAIDAHLAHVVAEVLLDDVHGEGVVARGHGGVRGEAGAGFHGFERRREVEFLFFHHRADAFETAEGGVPFVHVANGGVLAEGLEGANAADAEDDLLLDAGLLVAAVELGGDAAIFLAVLRDVGIEQVELNAADLDVPDSQEQFAARQHHRDENRRAVRVEFRHER